MSTSNGNGRTHYGDPVEVLIARLQSADCKPKPTGSGSFEARCPAHQGTRRNLSVSRGDDGRALVCCHHEPSCSTEAIVGAVGLSVADLFVETLGRHGERRGRKPTTKPTTPKAPPNASKPRKERKVHPSLIKAIKAHVWALNQDAKDATWKEVTAWMYLSADGQELMGNVRFQNDANEKTYRPVSKVERGWVTCDPPEPLPLLNLPGITTRPHDPVFLAEGEKAANALTKLGLVGTTSAHGAGSAHRSDWSPLAGRSVFVFPDHDEAGDKYADEVCRQLAALDPKPGVTVVRLPVTGDGEDVVDWLEKYLPDGWEPEECRAELIRLAYAGVPIDMDAATPPQGDGRPDIEITVECHQVVDEVCLALAREPSLYTRGATLATVIREHKPTALLYGGVKLRNAEGSPRIITLAPPAVRCMMTKNMTFFAYKKGPEGGEAKAVSCQPPGWLINAVATRAHWSTLRPLLSIAQVPFVRSDGTIPEAGGYDEATATLFIPSTTFLPVPPAPTQEDARAAWVRLGKLIDQFPFASDNARAVWLAGLLNAFQRPAISGPTPGIALVGNKAGCGKGLLIDLISILAWGMPAPTSDYPSDPIEAQKVKVAIALAGKPLIHFDNLEEGKFYGNRVLDSALTAMMVDDRILGTSQMTGEVPLRPCWFLSGNNVAPGKDAHRRWLPCPLETSLEHPEERPDIEQKNLRSYVLEKRPEIVRDVLTILRAHALANRPKGNWAPLGSFEEWDQVIRGAVHYATGIDCCATQKDAAAEAPERLEKLALLEAWQDLPEGGPKGQGHTVKAALDFAYQSLTTTAQCPELRDALIAINRKGELPTPLELGNRLRAMRGAVLGGLSFKLASTKRRYAYWRVDGEREVIPETDTTPPDSQKECESVSLGESVFHHEKNGTGTHSEVGSNGSGVNREQGEKRPCPESDSRDSQTHSADPAPTFLDDDPHAY